MPDRTVHRLDPRGTVRDWLVTPAWSEPADDLDTFLAEDGPPWGPDGRWVLTNGPDVARVKMRLYQAHPLRLDQPMPPVAEGALVSYLGPTGRTHTGVWQRVHTPDDGLVDWSAFCFTPERRLALAATVVEVDQAETRTLRLATTAPAALYLDGELILHHTSVSYMEPVEDEVDVWLPSGTSTLVVATWQVAFRECRHVARLRIGGLPVRVALPSPGADERVSTVAEQVLGAVGVAEWGCESGEVRLSGPDGAALRVSWPGGERRLRLTGGWATVPLHNGARASGDQVGNASMLSSGEVKLRVVIDDDRSPVFRELPVAMLPPAYRDEPVGEPDRWRAELLSHVAALPLHHGSAVELARTVSSGEGGDPHVIRPAALEHPLWMIDRRADCADFEILGLLHLWHRVPPAGWPGGLRERVCWSLRHAKYWIDQPGLDAMCYFTENHQLVWHTAEMLVGEAFADEKLDNTGWTGREHAEHGRALAQEWIARKLASGFSEFDSNAYLAIDTLALVSIVEFGTDRALAAKAAGLLDKLLFTLAVNSWRGVHGSPHGRTYVQTLRSSRLEETGPIMWACWGMGALNTAVLPATVIATARRYRVPAAVRAAAHHRPAEWLGRQRYAGEYRMSSDLLSRPYESDMVVYRTPDMMLGCVEDYRSGLPGLQEHIWGATLGPETQIYVNHAPNAATHSSARPNAWAGNRILPRAHQHLDTVLALYRIPPDDPMGYTHAWFPTSTMDEWRVHGSWCVGRRGDGYVALSTEGGCALVTAGPDAYQELRSVGPGLAWVCVVGRQATDGTFDAFVEALGKPNWSPTSITYTTRHGTVLRLDTDGPFTVDGRPTDLDAHGRPVERYHLDNPLCRVRFGDPTMTIAVDGLTHVIDLRSGRTVDG
jgi:hypothetical protein